MVTLAPIDNSYVPYTKRPVLKHNAALFVDGTRGRNYGGARVVRQSTCEANCTIAAPGTRCWCGPCDPVTRTRPILRCHGNRCIDPDTEPC
jgi:hypothetical protein